jgi:two-component system OmpR family sensor kinase
VHAVADDGRELLGRAVPAAVVEQARARAAAPAGQLAYERSGDRTSERSARGVRIVEAGNGQRLLLFVPLADGAGSSPRGEAARAAQASRRSAPPQPGFAIAIGLLASLAFSALLAAYLVRPIRHLRRAFADAAEGRLDTRVAPLMGSRRDEIAGLGEDFDRMAERLQKLISSQRRLLHDVSHELRSPLARLQAAAGLARQDPARTAAMLDRIERDTQRLDTLVGELLTLARLEADAGNAARQPADLGELLHEVVDDARFEAQASGRDVLLEGADAPVPIARAHPEWLQRAFENVIRNAVRHTPEGSAVRVRLRQEHAPDPREPGTRIVITVADEGSGVPPEQLESIFEPFQRGGASTDGHGLGLAIARHALAAHHGSISAANRPGGGLEVTMNLPAG